MRESYRGLKRRIVPSYHLGWFNFRSMERFNRMIDLSCSACLTKAQFHKRGTI